MKLYIHIYEVIFIYKVIYNLIYTSNICRNI